MMFNLVFFIAGAVFTLQNLYLSAVRYSRDRERGQGMEEFLSERGVPVMGSLFLWLSATGPWSDMLWVPIVLSVVDTGGIHWSLLRMAKSRGRRLEAPAIPMQITRTHVGRALPADHFVSAASAGARVERYAAVESHSNLTGVATETSNETVATGNYGVSITEGISPAADVRPDEAGSALRTEDQNSVRTADPTVQPDRIENDIDVDQETAGSARPTSDSPSSDDVVAEHAAAGGHVTVRTDVQPDEVRSALRTEDQDSVRSAQNTSVTVVSAQERDTPDPEPAKTVNLAMARIDETPAASSPAAVKVPTRPPTQSESIPVAAFSATLRTEFPASPPRRAPAAYVIPSDSMSAIKIGLIGGSGLGAALGAQTEGTRHEIDTPFGQPSDAIIETNWGGLPIFFLSRHGPGHRFGPGQVPFRANIFALKALGVTHIIASGAVGSLREEFRPRDLVIPDQIIDKTSRRAGTFFENAAVHVEFAEPFCPVLRRILVEEGRRDGETVGRRDEQASVPPSPRPAVSPSGMSVHDRGCYVCMEGPAFSTRAESLMHRLWGGDLIGMTAMPEAKLAREAEIPYALVALVTDYDCWRNKPAGAADKKPDSAELLKEIIANLQSASDNGIALIRRAVERIAAQPDLLADCPARDALKLAIWSDKNLISREEVERLAPLWMRHFEGATV